MFSETKQNNRKGNSVFLESLTSSKGQELLPDELASFPNATVSFPNTSLSFLNAKAATEHTGASSQELTNTMFSRNTTNIICAGLQNDT